MDKNTLKKMSVIVFITIIYLGGIVNRAIPQKESSLPLGASSSSSSRTFPSDGVTIFVDPDVIVGSVNDLVTFSVKVFNLTDNEIPDPSWPFYVIPLGNLWSIRMNFTWDPTVLQYVDHIKTMPVETYPNGILHDPISIISEELDAVAGFYHFSASSAFPATVFNNPDASNTIFEMTFNVISEASTKLSLPPELLDLADDEMNPIGTNYAGSKVYLHTGQETIDGIKYDWDGEFRTAGVPTAIFSFWPTDAGVINKPVIFNASASEDLDGTIESYTWDFGDGTSSVTETDPITIHTYAEAGTYTVILNVTDDDGLSNTAQESVKVVESRSIKIEEVVALPTRLSKYLLVNTTGDIDVLLTNDGQWDENVTLSAYYNNTSFDLTGKISASDWTEIATQSMTVGILTTERGTIHWNTTGVPEVEAWYYILVNATGVPYDRNATDNSNIISDNPVFVTATSIHDAVVTKLESGYLLKKQTFLRPVIQGENTTTKVTVLNDGTTSDTFDVTLYINGLTDKTWTTELQSGQIQELEWKVQLAPGTYNITAFVTVENEVNVTNNSLESTLRVIKPPILEITYNPTSPLVNDKITLDASASSHQEPEASLTKYTWEIYSIFVQPSADLPTFTSQGVTGNFTPTIPGNWIIFLKVTDNFNIKYDFDRVLGTDSYVKRITIEVGARESPILIYMIIAGVCIAAVAIAIVLYMRRKS